ncbi:MAG TPA: IS110 family transposase [Candidatus Binatia bacterium]
MKRYYVGVDWADEFHQVWVSDAEGKKVIEIKLVQKAEAMSEFGRWLHERQAEQIELWAAIEKPPGRIVDFLLDHGVVVYPVNPKALDRVRDRFRMSQSKSDSFDAYVLAEFVRTDHAHLRALEPNSAQAQEIKMLTRDHHRLMRYKTRLINQIEVTLKEYYPRPLEVFSDLESKIALDFLTQYPTPRALSDLTRRKWNRFAKREHHLGEARCKELWEQLNQPQFEIPQHVVRAKAQLLLVLVAQLRALAQAVESYSEEVQRFFASMPAARLAQTLPGGKSGTIVPMLWAELGDAKNRWQSFRHLQAEAGGVPVTKSSGKSRVVVFRYACNKLMRYASYWLSFNSLNRCEWANKYYRDQRAKGHRHPQALRALAGKWLKIIFIMWRDKKPYDENYHLANIARQAIRQAA